MLDCCFCQRHKVIRVLPCSWKVGRCHTIPFIGGTLQSMSCNTSIPPSSEPINTIPPTFCRQATATHPTCRASSPPARAPPMSLQPPPPPPPPQHKQTNGRPHKKSSSSPASAKKSNLARNNKAVLHSMKCCKLIKVSLLPPPCCPNLNFPPIHSCLARRCHKLCIQEQD